MPVQKESGNLLNAPRILHKHLYMKNMIFINLKRIFKTNSNDRSCNESQGITVYFSIVNDFIFCLIVFVDTEDRKTKTFLPIGRTLSENG